MSVHQKDRRAITAVSYKYGCLSDIDLIHLETVKHSPTLDPSQPG
jgi:hypothetical protein